MLRNNHLECTGSSKSPNCDPRVGAVAAVVEAEAGLEPRAEGKEVATGIPLIRGAVTDFPGPPTDPEEFAAEDADVGVVIQRAV